MAWHSHARQTKTLEHILELKTELEETLDEHVSAETQMRHANLALEDEVKALIDKYDAEMFERHRAIEKLQVNI